MYSPTISLLVLWAGLSCAQLLPMNLPSRGLVADLPAGSTSPAALLFARETTSCPSGAKTCDDGCIPSSGQCCSSGHGGWCSPGTHCQAGGCCPDGQACPGSAEECPSGTEFCGDKCMPQGAVCCEQNLYYCAAGSKCTSSGLCDDGRNESGCTADEDTCGGGCMPKGQLCCSSYYCARGYNCGSGTFECAVQGGNGTGAGGGPVDACGEEFEVCGESCMPKGGVCCDGFYCPAGSTCAPEEKCATSDGMTDGRNSTSTTSSAPSATSSGPSRTAETTEGKGARREVTSAAILTIFMVAVQLAA